MIDINTQRLLARDAQLCGDEDEQLVWVRSVLDRALNDVHTCCPGIIDSFDAQSLTVKVKPALQRLFFPDGEDAKWVDLPPLVDVPVVVLGGGDYSLTFPIHRGDECLLLFAERSIDNWFERGEASAPAYAHRHSLSDGFALVGVRNRQRPIENYNQDAVELRSSDGETRVELQSNRVHIEQRGKTIDLTPEGITLNAPTVRVEGQLQVNGSITATGNVVGGGISLQAHFHGGVMSGGSVTGPPQ